jgi:hypothetical protein
MTNTTNGFQAAATHTHYTISPTNILYFLLFGYVSIRQDIHYKLTTETDMGIISTSTSVRSARTRTGLTLLS